MSSRAPLWGFGRLGPPPSAETRARRGRTVSLNSVKTRRLSADRRAHRGDWESVREICCRTGNNGAPVARERWRFFARVWIEPYEVLAPEWTYVAEHEGRIIGYLTGCPDSDHFSRRRAWRLTWPLIARILFGEFRNTPGARAFARQALGLQQSQEAAIPYGVRAGIYRTYPAHLHINIEAEYRRAGLGRRLIETYCADLRREGIAGVHLFCGADPVRFYVRAGFEVLASGDFHGAPVFAMGRRL